jgi:hypothetical protein
MVSGAGFMVSGLGCRLEAYLDVGEVDCPCRLRHAQAHLSSARSALRVHGSGFRVYGSGLIGWGLGQG